MLEEIDMKNAIIPLTVTAVLAGGMSVQAADKPVPYPEGYRNWHHIKSMVIQPGHPLADPFEGMHHVYANEKALKGLRKGGGYEDGAVLVFDLLHAVEGGNAIQEGERKLVGVMVRNAKTYAATGGWGFEGFAGSSRTERLTKDGGVSCFNCHASEKDRQYVFSRMRD
jgi:hypothetical protein